MSMRKFYLLSGLILAGLAGVTHPLRAQAEDTKLAVRAIEIADGPAAKDAAPAAPFCDNCAPHSLCWSVNADFLYWTSRGDTINYAQVRDAVDPNVGTARGSTGNLDSTYSMGFRIGGAAILTPAVELDVNFTWWQNRSTDTLGVDPASGFIIFPLAGDFRAFNAGEFPLTAQAHQDIHLLVGDVTLKYLLCGTDCNSLKLLAGLRGAHLDQNFQVYYTHLNGTSSVQSQINFDGFGPRLGLEGEYTIYGSWFVRGRADLSLLYGTFGTSYQQVNAIAGAQVNTDATDDRVVPVFETELGIGYRSCNKRWEVIVGYSGVNWFNTVTTSSWLQQVRQDPLNADRHQQSELLSFDGLFARVNFKF